MREPTKLSERAWFVYFKSIAGEHDSGYGLFEVGYVDSAGSRIALNRTTDVVTIEPPRIGRVQLDHHPASDEVMIGPAGNKQLWPFWSEVSGAECKVEWTEHPPKLTFIQCMPRGPGEADPQGRADLRGKTRANPPPWTALDPEPTTPAEAGEGERHHVERE
jgi:hypothetical protein